MRRAFAALLVLGALVFAGGCEGGLDLPSISTESVITELAKQAGYEIENPPTYDGTRWKMDVRVPGCNTPVTLGGPEAPKSTIPTSVTVLAIGGVPYEELRQTADPANLTVAKLLAVPELKQKLDCTG
jgi:hypothetical protein